MTGTWVYQQTEPSLWTVGYYKPDGKWESDSDWDDRDAAAERCRKLNGGNDEPTAWAPEPGLIEPEPATPFAQWAIIELMGHRRLAGYLTEQEIAGRGFLRLEVPGQPAATQFYSPAAVYCLTPTTEDIARAVAKGSRPEPVQRWELPAAPSEDDEGPF